MIINNVSAIRSDGDGNIYIHTFHRRVIALTHGNQIYIIDDSTIEILS